MEIYSTFSFLVHCGLVFMIQSLRSQIRALREQKGAAEQDAAVARQELQAAQEQRKRIEHNVTEGDFRTLAFDSC